MAFQTSGDKPSAAAKGVETAIAPFDLEKQVDGDEAYQFEYCVSGGSFCG